MTIVNYDWDELEDNIAEEYDDTGATVAEYTTEPNVFGNVLSQRREGQDSYYHYDGQGSALALTNANGSGIDTYTYSAFGEVILHSGGTVNPYQYCGTRGYYQDVETGVRDIRYRPLDSRAGRWLTKDPTYSNATLQQIGGNFTSHFGSSTRCGLFSYVLNNPLLFSDPAGLFEVRLQVDAFIPPAWVFFALGFDLKGDSRMVRSTPPGPSASRVTTIVNVEMEQCVANQRVITFNQTVLSPSTRRFYGLPFGVPLDQTLLGTYSSMVSAQRTGKCDVHVDIRTTATIPWLLAPGAPSIDWDFHFDLRAFEVVDISEGMNVSASISGRHDEFPAYEAYVNSYLVYSHTPKTTIFALFPPLDVNVGGRCAFGFSSWESKHASCCDCKGDSTDFKIRRYTWKHRLCPNYPQWWEYGHYF